MAALLVLAVFALAAVVFSVALFGLLVSVMVRLILFPFFLLKWILSALVMLVVGPILAIVGLVLAFAFGIVLAVPLMPLLLVAAILWLLLKSTRRPAVA